MYFSKELHKIFKIEGFSEILECDIETKMEFPQPKRSWLVRTTAVDGFPPLDPETVAMLRKDYADMFETGEARWKVNFDKHIANARKLEESKAKESSNDA